MTISFKKETELSPGKYLCGKGKGTSAEKGKQDSDIERIIFEIKKQRRYSEEPTEERVGFL